MTLSLKLITLYPYGVLLTAARNKVLTATTTTTTTTTTTVYLFICWEAVQPSAYGDCLEIRRSRVQETFWPLVEFDPGNTWFNFLAALVNSQLLCRRPVGNLKVCSVQCSEILATSYSKNLRVNNDAYLLIVLALAFYNIIYFSINLKKGTSSLE